MSRPKQYDDYSTGLRVERTLAYLSGIPDPIHRARECSLVADQARGIQGEIGAVRRQAVYEATLRPGSTGESVAAELGVSPKAVSLASSEFRRTDLALFREALHLYAAGATDSLTPQAITPAVNTRDVIVAAKTVSRADVGRLHGEIPATDWKILEKASDRARALLTTAKVEFERPLWLTPTLAYATEPDYSAMAPSVRRAVQVLNALPGILAQGWESRESPAEWWLSWQILPAEAHSTVFDSGPHRDGWAATEWLVWFTHDLIRSDKQVHLHVTSPPPYLNQPGESLSFNIWGIFGDGRNTYTPGALAEWLIKLWNDCGFTEVIWPKQDDLA